MKKIIKLNQVEQQNNSGNLQQPLVAFLSIFWPKSQSVTNIITNLAAVTDLLVFEELVDC